MGAAATVCAAGGGIAARGLTYYILDLVSFYDTFAHTSTTWREEETQKCKRTYTPA